MSVLRTLVAALAGFAVFAPTTYLWHVSLFPGPWRGR